MSKVEKHYCDRCGAKITEDEDEDEVSRLNSILRSMHLTETEAHRMWLKFDWNAFERLYESTYGKRGKEKAND